MIVAAAIAVIGESGLEAFSMSKLAATLGVRTPSLYHYFANKDALFESVARTVLTPDAPTTLPPDAHWTDYLVTVSVALVARSSPTHTVPRWSCDTRRATTCSTSTSRRANF
jgi:AcrR family transcriptional regulator